MGFLKSETEKKEEHLGKVLKEQAEVGVGLGNDASEERICRVHRGKTIFSVCT